MSSSFLNWKLLQKYLTPQAGDDFSRFLDGVPGHVGRATLIAAGIVWVVVAMMGLFTMMQAKQLTELKAELQTIDALKPVVPVASVVPVPSGEINQFVEKIRSLYPTLSIGGNNGIINIKSKQTTDFAQFREAVGHVVNGGLGWKVAIESMCVGRECKDSGLGASLKIQKLNIDKPSS